MEIEVLKQTAYVTKFNLSVVFEYKNVTYDIIDEYEYGGSLGEISLCNADSRMELDEDDFEEGVYDDIIDYGTKLLSEVDIKKHLEL